MKWCYEGCERGLGSPRYSRRGDRRYTFYRYITRRLETEGSSDQVRRGAGLNVDAFPQGLNGLRNKSCSRAEWAKGMPQGLKPDVYFVAFAARLKSCPDACRSGNRVFPQPVKPGHFAGACGTGPRGYPAAPFQNIALRLGYHAAKAAPFESEAAAVQIIMESGRIDVSENTRSYAKT